MVRTPEMIPEEYDPNPEVLGEPELAGINIYPVKSFAGTSLEVARVGSKGFLLDRHWMVTTPEGRFLTQREIPQMALVRPVIDERYLILKAPDMPDIGLPIDQKGAELVVDIWKSIGVRAMDLGSDVANWLKDALGHECRLVRMQEDEVRQVDRNFAQEGDEVDFADGYPFLIISEGSLNDLNSKLAQPLPMNRFRPNLVVRGVAPYAEDRWKRIRIGGIELEVVKACARCKITTTDQETANVGKEPLATLARYRRHDHLGITYTTGVFFGQNAIHRNQGTLRLGDRLEVLEF